MTDHLIPIAKALAHSMKEVANRHYSLAKLYSERNPVITQEMLNNSAITMLMTFEYLFNVARSSDELMGTLKTVMDVEEGGYKWYKFTIADQYKIVMVVGMAEHSHSIEYKFSQYCNLNELRPRRNF